MVQYLVIGWMVSLSQPSSQNADFYIMLLLSVHNFIHLLPFLPLLRVIFNSLSQCLYHRDWCQQTLFNPNNSLHTRNPEFSSFSFWMMNTDYRHLRVRRRRRRTHEKRNTSDGFAETFQHLFWLMGVLWQCCIHQTCCLQWKKDRTKEMKYSSECISHLIYLILPTILQYDALPGK